MVIQTHDFSMPEEVQTSQWDVPSLQADDGGNHSMALLLRGEASTGHSTFETEIMDVQNRHGWLFIVCANP